nr:aminopeptidase M1-like isoform X1 [Tanacetum cinerariifolium]
KVVPSEVVVDKDDETLVLVFDEALHVGDGMLEIKFSGVINEHMKGFYQGKFGIVNAFSTDDLLPCNGNVNIPSLSSLNVSSIVAWRLANLLGHVVLFCHTGCLDLLFSSAAATF